jgi:hypothetical protein
MTDLQLENKNRALYLDTYHHGTEFFLTVADRDRDETIGISLDKDAAGKLLMHLLRVADTYRLPAFLEVMSFMSCDDEDDEEES